MNVTLRVGLGGAESATFPPSSSPLTEDGNSSSRRLSRCQAMSPRVHLFLIPRSQLIHGGELKGGITP